MGVMRPRLTARELDVMSALWALGEATVADVRSRLAADLAHTTVLNVLRGLESKGHVEHETHGRAFVYRARLEPDEAAVGLVDRVLDRIFLGSPVKLLAHLVSRRRIAPDELERMRRLLDEHDPGDQE